MTGDVRLKECPACGNSDTLWRGVLVSGWEAVTVTEDESVSQCGTGALDRDVDWTCADEDGTWGCSCGWEGVKAQLVTPPQLGWDGKPLPEVGDGQETLL
jgi:hypothetical protein